MALPPEQPFRRGGSIRARLLIVFLYLALLCTNGGLIYRSYGEVVRTAQLNNLNLARAVTERLDGTFAEADHIIDALNFELEREESGTVTALRLQPLMVNHVARSSRLKDLFIFDRDGSWLTATTPVWTAASNSSQRPYFVFHSRNPSERTRVGPPIVSQSSGEWVVPVSRRYNDSNGRFAGVVLATLSIKDLRAMLERFEIGSGAITLTVADHYMVRRPYVEKDVGNPLPPSIQAIFQGRRSGSGDIKSPIDGVTRIFSFAEANAYPVRALVAASKAEVLREWAIWSSLQSLWTAFLCVILYRAVIYFRRSIISRVEAEAQIRHANEVLSTANAKLSRLARLDALTGLANRGYFDHRLAQALKQAWRDQAPLAVVLLDVDHFKQYNDRYGHLAGDECLRRIASALRTAARRPDDLVARYGGEEMAILLPHTDMEGAKGCARAAWQAVRDLRIEHVASATGHLTISLGVAAWVPAAGETTDAILQAADVALYEAKRSGRDAIRIYGE